MPKKLSSSAHGYVKVATTDYYGEFQEAGDLKNGDNIYVRWPDGHKTQEKLRVIPGYGSAQIDMTGGPDRFRTQKLVVETKVHGIKINIPLKGLYIRKVEVT